MQSSESHFFVFFILSESHFFVFFILLHSSTNHTLGTVPTTIGNLLQLKEFTIDTNFLMTGTVPNEVCQLRTSLASSLVSLIVESCPASNTTSTTTTTSIKGVLCPSGSGNNSNIGTGSSSPSACCTSCRN